jgi:hypothetical protein
MDVIKFNQFIKENYDSDVESNTVELYRVVGVPSGESLVINTKNPGLYYFRNEEDIDTDVLSKDGDEYHVIKVKTTESNIDEELSAQESEKQGHDCVVLKDDSSVTYDGSTPL